MVDIQASNGVLSMSNDRLKLSEALAFASEAHANQRRKGPAQEPYINHLIEVMDLVAHATDGDDLDLMIAALLHDVLEDTHHTREDVEARFGARVAAIVVANSDNMRLPKPERQRRRIEAMAHKSTDAQIVKIADVISNVRAIAVSAPAGWTADKRQSYVDACRKLVDAGRGANTKLDDIFDETANEAERIIAEDRFSPTGGSHNVARHLETAIGQPVHLVYMPNTGCRPLVRKDVEDLAALASRAFPSVTIQHNEALYDGVLREILIARLRTDDRDSIVAFAQRLCLAFEQAFVGLEVDGRYIRIYADDTG